MTTPDPSTKGIGRRTLSGISWTLFGSIVSNVLRIAIVAVLGRLLSAEDFGVVAAAMTIVFFAGRIRELGIGLALVQRKEITREHVEATFGFSLLLGLLLGLGIFLAADALAAIYHLPVAADPIRVLAVLFVLRGASSTSQFLCQRDLKFRAITLIDITAYILGSITSIVLAVAGMGPWALVIGYVVETGVDSLLMMWVRPPPWTLRIRWHALRDLLGFGGGTTVAGIANYFANQGDYVVVGRFLDVATLGVYTRAYELMRFPAMVFTNIAGSVLFASFSRLQDDPARLGTAFRRVLFANAVLLLPASAGLIVLAPEAIRILLGPGWDGVVIPFQIMATSMLWRASHKAAAIVARSSGDVLRIAVWQAAYAIAVIGGALVSVRWGITGVSITTALAVFFHFTNLTRLALRRLDIGWRAVVLAHLDGVWLAALAVAGALPVAWLLRGHGLGAAPVAIAATLAGTLVPAAYALLQVRRGSPDWVWLADRAKDLVRRKQAKPVGGGRKKARLAQAEADRLAAEGGARSDSGPGE